MASAPCLANTFGAALFFIIIPIGAAILLIIGALSTIMSIDYFIILFYGADAFDLTIALGDADLFII
jgi:hypothetical protein